MSNAERERIAEMCQSASLTPNPFAASADSHILSKEVASCALITGAVRSDYTLPSTSGGSKSPIDWAFEGDERE